MLLHGATAGDSVLHRRNPTVKLAAVLVVSAVLLAVFDPFTPGLLYLVALAAVPVLGRIPPRTLAAAQIPFLAFAGSLFLINAVTRGGAVVASYGPLEVTTDGLAVGASLAFRTLVIGVCSAAFVLTTDPGRLMVSLHQHARLSPRVAYGVLAGYRLLGWLPQEWVTIRRAHAVRQPRRRPGRLPRSPRALAAAAFTLLVTALRRGDRVALALESRGLGAGPRTLWRPVPLTGTDWVFLLAVVGAVAVAISVSAALGFLRGWSALTAY